MSWSPFYNFFDRDGFYNKENGAEDEWFKFYVNNETRLHKTWTGRSELSLSITDRYGSSSEQHTGRSRSKSIIYLPSPQNNKLMYNYISLTRETFYYVWSILSINNLFILFKLSVTVEALSIHIHSERSQPFPPFGVSNRMKRDSMLKSYTTVSWKG